MKTVATRIYFVWVLEMPKMTQVYQELTTKLPRASDIGWLWLIPNSEIKINQKNWTLQHCDLETAGEHHTIAKSYLTSNTLNWNDNKSQINYMWSLHFKSLK